MREKKELVEFWLPPGNLETQPLSFIAACLVKPGRASYDFHEHPSLSLVSFGVSTQI